jgi:hypothetical protein
MPARFSIPAKSSGAPGYQNTHYSVYAKQIDYFRVLDKFAKCRKRGYALDNCAA